MGNTLEETEPTNSIEGATIIMDVHENFSELNELWIPNKRLSVGMNNVLDMIDDDMSQQNLNIGLKT